MATFRAELHVHTVLSPCADVEMIPPLIVQTALEKNIDMIAITDHNSTKNVEAVYRAAETTPLVIIPGVEIQTKEEVHSICLFPDLGTLRDFQTILDQTLPDAPNKADFFGEQYIIDETGDFIAYETRLLMNSLELSLTEAFQEVEKRNGLIFPAHIDRKWQG